MATQTEKTKTPAQTKSNQPTKSMNAQVGVEVEFLGADLLGGYQKDDNGTILVVKQMNAGENSRPVGLGKLKKDIQKIAGGKFEPPKMEGDDGEDKLTAILNAYDLRLKQAYLKIETKKDKTSDKEYALWVSIEAKQEELDKLKDSMPIFEIVSLKKIGIKVWNTSNPKVIQEMNLVDLRELAGVGTKAIENKSTTGEDA